MCRAGREAAFLLLFFLCVLIANSCFILVSNKMRWHQNWAYCTDFISKSNLEWNNNPGPNPAAIQVFRNCVIDHTRAWGHSAAPQMGSKQRTHHSELLSPKIKICAKLSDNVSWRPVLKFIFFILQFSKKFTPTWRYHSSQQEMQVLILSIFWPLLIFFFLIIIWSNWHINQHQLQLISTPSWHFHSWQPLTQMRWATIWQSTVCFASDLVNKENSLLILQEARST